MKWMSVVLGLLMAATLPVHAESEPLDALVAKCGMCHGADGNSPTSNIPSIAGITKEFFRYVMDGYKKSGRESEVMKMFAHSVDAEGVEKLADYYSKQTFKPVKQSFDAQLAAKGKDLHMRYCEKCHENGGKISDNNYGILAGQWGDYLRQAIQDYLDEKRRTNPPMMLVKLKKLQEAAGKEGIEQLVNYYASQQ